MLLKNGKNVFFFLNFLLFLIRHFHLFPMQIIPPPYDIILHNILN